MEGLSFSFLNQNKSVLDKKIFTNPYGLWCFYQTKIYCNWEKMLIKLIWIF